MASLSTLFKKHDVHIRSARVGKWESCPLTRLARKICKNPRFGIYWCSSETKNILWDKGIKDRQMNAFIEEWDKLAEIPQRKRTIAVRNEAFKAALRKADRI